VLLYWGQTAKKRLEELVAGRGVQVTFPAADKADKYGRLLGRLHINGQDINMLMVSEGLAMVYRKSSFPDKSRYYDAERRAQQARNGFWGHPAFRDVLGKLHATR
jgi:endonuclease YncB( thermonuclease family)